MFAASAVDLLSTEWGLANDFGEGNPAASQRGVRIATHIVAPATVWWATGKLERSGNRKLALILRISVMAVYGYAAMHNVRVVSSQPTVP
jgi:hypothetical protein